MNKKSRRKTREEFMEMADKLNRQPKFLKLDDPRLIDRLPEPLTGDMNYTPKEIAEDMLDLLPEEIWSDPNATFLDIVSKSGIFLDRAYFRLFKGLKKVIPDHYDRRRHILTKQLYGVVSTDECLNTTKLLLYGSTKANDRYSYVGGFWDKDNIDGNIKHFGRCVGMIDKKGRTRYKEFFEIVSQEDEAAFELTKRFAKEALNNMKFDVVVGNPPYNRGMDLDFVNLGFNICKKYCIMITPAKWQTAADDYSGCASKTIDYKGFRKKLVPHMSKVVFYPDVLDIFNIGQVDGITYYLLDKNNRHKECEVENKCNKQEKLNNNVKRNILSRESLNNIGNEIVEYLGNYKKFRFIMQRDNKYQVWTNNQVSVGGNGHGQGVGLLNSQGTTYCIGISRIVDTSKGEKSTSKASECIFSSDNRAECESFVSWLNTKFTRFFVAINISKLGPILTDDCFRFVPAPPEIQSGNPWDHIYTDEELYKAFNLPQKYIDVIEAVIKDRK